MNLLRLTHLPLPRSRSVLLLVVLLAVLAVLHPQSARAADGTPTRHALVIGNAAYGSKPLSNPVRDAELMAQTLKTLDFNVTVKHNLSRKELFETLATFADGLPTGAMSFVYYAGHGMQIGGANYLLPVELVPTSEQGVATRAYPLKNLLERLQTAKSAVNVVVLDACRDNPFLPASRYRSYTELGLSRTVAPKGTLIAYSTAPGQLAEDGAGVSHSFYSETLSKSLLQPAKPIETVLKEVAEQVRRKTLDDQQPWFESSIVDELYLLPPKGTKVIAPRPLKTAQASTTSMTSTRGMTPEASNALIDVMNPWFMSLSEKEWTQLDWEIQQRVKRMTPDELPGLIHKANGGNVVAQTTLGLAYRDGVEKATDPATGRIMRFKANNTEAVKWLRRAATAGFPVAQAELGEMYYQGHAVDRDLATSRELLEKAASVPYPRPKLDLMQLGVVERSGIGKPAFPGNH